MAKVGLQIKFQTRNLRPRILKAISKTLRPKLSGIAIRISKKIQLRFKQLILLHPTIKDILDRKQIRGELGVNREETRINNIVDTWIGGLILNTKPVMTSATSVRGGFILQMVKSDWSEVLSLPDAWITERTIRPLDWLNWLLTEGSKTVVIDYDFELNAGQGRTGQGRMLKNFKRRLWSVPPAYQGTQDNNFATQTIDRIHVEIPNMIEDEFERAL